VERKKIVGVGLKESEGETRIRVLLGANPRKSSNRFLINYKAEKNMQFAVLAYVHYVYLFIFIFYRPVLKWRVKATKLFNGIK